MADTIVCDASELLSASRCISCIPKAYQQQVLIYLLAVMAGLGTDKAAVTAMVKASACFDIDKSIREPLIAYLLCQIANKP